MRIIFNDNSFLELLPEKDGLTLVLCGRKSHKEVTMSSANLSEEQITELINFLINWENNKSNSA